MIVELDKGGVRRLLANILIFAVEDLERERHRDDALAFFASTQLDWIADGLELRPERVRERVAEGIDPALLKYARRAYKNESRGAMARRVREIESGEAARAKARRKPGANCGLERVFY
jgi:hypothetical protein